MAEQAWQVYRRGFLGKLITPEKTQSETNIILDKLKQLQYNPQVLMTNKDSNFLANEEVEKLYGIYFRRENGTALLEFHKQVLEAFIHAFGTASFLEWLAVQQKSLAASYLHSKFLMDTLRFLDTGHREMSLETWEPLLNDAKHDDDWEDVIAYANQIHQSKKISRLKDVAIVWCQQPSGIYDMLRTLHILFGK